MRYGLLKVLAAALKWVWKLFFSWWLGPLLDTLAAGSFERLVKKSTSVLAESRGARLVPTKRSELGRIGKNATYATLLAPDLELRFFDFRGELGIQLRLPSARGGWINVREVLPHLLETFPLIDDLAEAASVLDQQWVVLLDAAR